MFVQIIALGPKMALIWGSIVLHRLIKGNVENLQVSDSGPLWPSCLFFNFFSNSVNKPFFKIIKICILIEERLLRLLLYAFLPYIQHL